MNEGFNFKNDVVAFSGDEYVAAVRTYPPVDGHYNALKPLMKEALKQIDLFSSRSPSRGKRFLSK